MSHVRCRSCSLIIEAAPHPPNWRCPNCLAVNPVMPRAVRASAALDRASSARWFEHRGH